MTARECREGFDKDRKDCRLPLTHIMAEARDAKDPFLREVDELFGAADVLSIENAKKHRRVLLGLSAAGTLLTLAFLLYDEIDVHGMIFACGAMLLTLFFIHRLAGRSDCHRKYLEYRVLAESLRVQYFLSLAGVRTRVADILPWSLRKGVPWAAELLGSLPAEERTEKRSVLDCWIKDQKAYHISALKKAETKNARDEKTAGTVLWLTVSAYILASGFEIAAFNGAAFGDSQAIRMVFKIMLGTMSVVTLFTGSYYGKMSLPNVIDDHKRMIALYYKAKEDIAAAGESEELLLLLARECLNENSAWYAYQSKNKSDLVI